MIKSTINQKSDCDNAFAAQPLIVFAAQRSGTTVFERTLEQGPAFHRYGEVFVDPRDHDSLALDSVRHNFFHFRNDIFAGNPWMSIPTEQNQRVLFQSFVHFLSQESPKPWFIVDIKYNSTHHFNGAARLQSDPPNLLNYMLEMQLPIIQLIRRDASARACSEIIANARHEWHLATGGDRRRGQKVAISLETLQWHLDDTQNRMTAFRNKLEGYDRYLEVSYEDLFDGTQLAESIVSQVESLCGSPLEFDRTLPQAKIIRELADEIENYDEVFRFVQDTYSNYQPSPWVPQDVSGIPNRAILETSKS